MKTALKMDAASNAAKSEAEISAVAAARPKIAPQRLIVDMRRQAGVMLAIAIVASGQSAFAVDRVWNAGTASFDVATNWTPNGIPVTADNASVNNGGTSQIAENHTVNDLRTAEGAASSGSFLQTAGTVTLSAGWFRMGITAGRTGTYNLQGGTLGVSTTSAQINIGETGIGILNMSGGTFNANARTAVSRDAGSNGTLNLSGGTYNVLAGFTSVGLAATSTGTMNISGGSFINSAAQDFNVGDSGTGTLTISGTGVLNTNNGFGVMAKRQTAATATVNLDGGTVITNQFRQYNAVGTGTLNFNGGTAQSRRNDVLPLTTAGGTGPFVTGFTRANVRNGGAIFNTPMGITSGVGNALLHSNVAGDAETDGGLTKNGAGILTLLSTGNAYTGPTVINTGTLQIGDGGANGSLPATPVTNNGALAFNSSGNLTIGGAISGTGTVAQNGTGITRLTGTNTYTGTTSVNAGALSVASLDSLPGFNTPGQVSVAANGILALYTGNDFATARSTSGNVTFGANSYFGLDTINAATGFTYADVIADGPNGANPGFAKIGGPDLILTGANTYTGPTLIREGALVAGNNAALGTADAGTIVPGGSTLALANGITIGAEALTINGNGKDARGALQADTGATATYGGPVTLGSAGQTAVSTRVGAQDGGTLTISGVIGNGTATGLDISAQPVVGTGGLVLTGVNTYTGATSVFRGNLIVDGSSGGRIDTIGSEVNIGLVEAASLQVRNGGLVNASNLVVSRPAAAAVVNTAFDLTSGTVNTAAFAVFGFGGAGTTTSTISGGTLNVKTTTTPANMEVGAFNSVNSTLTVSGPAAVNLQNNSNLNIGANNNTGTNTLIQNGGTITFFSDGGTTIGGAGALNIGAFTASGTKTFTQNGGTLIVPRITRLSTSTAAGKLNLNGGTIRAAAPSTTFISNLTNANILEGGVILDSNGNGITVPQLLAHGGTAEVDGGLTKTGAGALTLGGTNTYTGPTRVTAGTLALGGNERIDNTSSVVFNGGTFDVGGNTETLGTLDLQADSTLDLSGTSTANFADSSAVTFAAGTTLSVTNYSSADQFFVGNSASLSASQLAQIVFVNPSGLTGTFSATQMANGQVVPQINAATSNAAISEFRNHGAAGAADDYIELYNKTAAPLDISGWSVQYTGAAAAGVQTVTIPAATASLPVRGHYLLAGSAYSLGDNAPADQTLSVDIADDSGVRLLDTTGKVQDAVAFVGSTSIIAGEGTPLPIAPSDNGEYAFVRDESSGLPQDTNDNAADFVFVSINGAAYNGLTSTLGAPGAQNLASPVFPVTPLGVALFDTNVAVTARPNQVRVGAQSGPNAPQGTILFRRQITNNSGAPVTRLRVRVVRLTTLNSPGYSNNAQSDLRMLSSLGGPRASASQGGSVPVSNVTLEAPATEGSGANGGGGINSSALDTDVTLAAPLQPGAANSRNYEFLFRVVRPGSFNYALNIEVLPAQ